MTETAAVGLKVRTGHAVVVILRGTRRVPEIVVRYHFHRLRLAPLRHRVCGEGFGVIHGS